jgi:hypothetical protein
MTEPQVPPYLSPGEIARACGISRDKALTELNHASLVEWRGGRRRISASQLRERLSEMYDRVYTWFVLDNQPRRRPSVKRSA